MGLLKPVKWLGRLFRVHDHSAPTKAGPSHSSSTQPTRPPAISPNTQRALKRLISHPSLCECRQARRDRPGVAKATAFSVQHRSIVRRNHRQSQSVDLQRFTRSVAAGKEPFSEDIANRNILAQQFVKDGPKQSPFWQADNMYPTYATYHPRQLRKRILAKSVDLQRQESPNYSSGRKEPREADARPWTSRSSWSGDSGRRPSKGEYPGRQGEDCDVVLASVISLPSRLRSLSHKRRIPDLRLARELGHKRSQTFPGADPPRAALRPSITSVDLNKPLPPLPRVDDTVVHTTWAPAVTHHTIQQDVHELHQEQITHDIYQDEYQHRVLLVEDHEILPHRHFVQLDGGVLEEIPEEDIPVDLPHDLQHRISEAAATLFPTFRDSGVSFLSADGAADPIRKDEPSSLNFAGHARRDTTWTFPPVILPSLLGAESFHQLVIPVDDADGKVRTHTRSFSDGPPPIPHRGVRVFGVPGAVSLS